LSKTLDENGPVAEVRTGKGRHPSM
jgi:hypothetical protein